MDPIATIQQIIDRAPVPLEIKDQSALSEVLDGATAAIVAMCDGREFRSAVRSEVFDGDRRRSGMYRDILYAKHFPVATSPLPTVAEDGVSLTVGYAFDLDKDVIFDPDDGRFHRQNGIWSTGLRNIVIGYTAPSWSDPPQDIVSACVELTWLMWKTAAKSGGVDAASISGATFTAMRELSEYSERTLQRYATWMRQ